MSFALTSRTRRPRLQFSWSWSWQVISSLLIVGAGISLLLFAQLESLLPGYSPTEVATAQASGSLTAILENPLNAPYKLLVYGITVVGVDPLLATRIASAVIGTVVLLLFYVGLRQWHNKRVAFLTGILFACSFWFLQTSRFGSSDIMLPLVLLLFATCGYWIAASAQRSGVRYIVAIVALSLSVYIPGALWLLLIGFIVRRGKDLSFIKRRLLISQKLTLIGLLLLLVVAPLAYGLYVNPSLGLELLALPTTMPNWSEVAMNLLTVPASLIVWSEANPERILGNLPLLDVFAAAMLLLGLYQAIRTWKLDRSKLLLSVLVVGTALVALGNMPIAFLLPVIFVVIAGGISTLLGVWLTVFPRNPLARATGIIIVTIAVVASILFNLRAYFIAWSLNQDTKEIYSAQSVTIED